MSRIADRIRTYVNDYSVSEHYGAWGILRPDQRRLIRELCDTCDMFEKTADDLMRKQEWISVDERLPDMPGKYLVATFDGRVGIGNLIDYYCDGDLSFDNYKVTHWMPLPEAPKMKCGAE